MPGALRILPAGADITETHRGQASISRLTLATSEATHGGVSLYLLGMHRVCRVRQSSGRTTALIEVIVLQATLLDSPIGTRRHNFSIHRLSRCVVDAALACQESRLRAGCLHLRSASRINAYSCRGCSLQSEYCLFAPSVLVSGSFARCAGRFSATSGDDISPSHAYRYWFVFAPYSAAMSPRQISQARLR